MTYNLAPRKPLKGVQRQAFLVAHDSRCYFCGKPISDDLWDDEHILARELGGSDNMDNRKPIHRMPCHKIKTAQDRKLIAKSNRVRRKHGPPELRRHTKPIPSRPLSSRPFQRRAK